ncbi:MAG: glucuronate isomerase [Bacteroidia bacterium]|nr:glucuronate isomerase [Bacteroidia bacterium]
MHKIKPFLDENFLLENATAEILYHEFAKDQPIIDYHNHLPPGEILHNKSFSTLTEVWLKGDHYKWRAMRANGIGEEFITGSISDREKFRKWAETVPFTMRNPLYHWTHLELKRYFGIHSLLNASTADEVYDQATELLQQDAFSSRGLLEKMNVSLLCSTDDPTDDLKSHQALKKEGWKIRLLPGFRPDKFIMIQTTAFPDMLAKLEACTAKNIETFSSLMEALEERMDYFHGLGCRLSDHGLEKLYAEAYKEKEIEDIFRKRIEGKDISCLEARKYQSAILYRLALLYHKKNWTMQFHLGAIRNNNDRLMRRLGADVGADSIGDFEQARALSSFLNRLDREEKLAQTILYNLNPGDNEVFATMAGNYNDGSVPGKIQWGSAWWFLDQKDGMEKQIDALSNMGMLSRFIGMLTDSRSFLSFPRHEYFRRILCNLIGKDVHKGELPHDIPWLGKMVADICYGNAKRYFDF